MNRMDPLRELPMGFGMALFQNQQAAKYFSTLTETQKQAVISQTHQITSTEQMKAFVDNLPAATL